MTDTATEELRIKETIERLGRIPQRIYDIAQPMEGKSPFGDLVAVGNEVLELRYTLRAEIMKQAKSLKAITAERDAMAEALTKIANHPLNLSRGEPNDARQAEWESGEDYGTRRAAQVARKALESSQ